MRKFFLVALLSFCAVAVIAQDIFTRGIVYQLPAMKKVVVKENILYRSVNDTSLHFDIYYPPGFDYKKKLPLVVFNNGAGGMEIPGWGVYKDWAKLMAANDMIAVNYQTRNGSTLEDGEALLDYLVKNASQLNIDAGKIGMWTCSANTRTGMRIAYKTRPQLIKALVVYYGGPDSLGQLRQDLPTLLVRAALDAQFVNRGMENFIQTALQQDTRFELINYLNGIHAFDVYMDTDESREIIKRTVAFMKKSLEHPIAQPGYVLTNKNFMWLITNGQLENALAEFRKVRSAYRADKNFQPFFNAVIREDVLNANAYWLLQNQRPAEAIEVFKLATESYPGSSNAYESLSEGFETTGNKEEAIRNAELCLEKLQADSNLNDRFRQVIRRSAEDRIQRLKGATNSPAATIPGKRAHHALAYDEKNKNIFLTGGSTPVNAGNAGIFFNDNWVFDGKQWKLLASEGSKRSGIGLAYDSKRQQFFSFGGYSDDGSLADLRVWEGDKWKTISRLPAMKAAEPGFVYDVARDRFVIFGGSAARGEVNADTWEWDGSNWKKFEGKSPEGRQGFIMIYDSKRTKTVLYGGADGNGKAFTDGIWEFDGAKWENIPSKGADPGPRMAAGYTYDSKRNLLIIFSGNPTGTGDKKADTWSWNGQQWNLLSDKGPSKRWMGYLAYDKERDKVVMFGGRLGWPNDANDTWEWDGKEWKEVK